MLYNCTILTQIYLGRNPLDITLWFLLESLCWVWREDLSLLKDPLSNSGEYSMKYKVVYYIPKKKKRSKQEAVFYNSYDAAWWSDIVRTQQQAQEIEVIPMF